MQGTMPRNRPPAPSCATVLARASRIPVVPTAASQATVPQGFPQPGAGAAGGRWRRGMWYSRAEWARSGVLAVSACMHHIAEQARPGEAWWICSLRSLRR